MSGFYTATASWLSVKLDGKYAIRRTLFMFRTDCCMLMQKVTFSVGNEQGTENHEVCGSYQGLNGQSSLGQIGAITCSRFLIGTFVTFDIEVHPAASTSNPAGLVRVSVLGFKLLF